MFPDYALACAKFLEKQFTGLPVDRDECIRRVVESQDAFQHMGDHPQFPKSDLSYCTDIDALDFAMPIKRKDGQLVMQAVKN